MSVSQPTFFHPKTHNNKKTQFIKQAARGIESTMGGGKDTTHRGSGPEKLERQGQGHKYNKVESGLSPFKNWH